MDIRAELLKEHSKQQAVKIASWIGDDTEAFDNLISLFLGKEYRVCQRAAWAMSICADANPQLIRPYIKKLVRNLKKPVHDAVKRNTLRVLEKIEIPENNLGELADVCFDFLTRGNEPIAVKAYSIGILSNISKKEPALLQELKIILEDQLPYSGPAIKSRAKRVLNKQE